MTGCSYQICEVQDWNILTPAVDNCILGDELAELSLNGISLKRLDLNDATIQGNKAYKLKYNMAKAEQAGYGTILTFGGAWSNHIYSTAAACKRFGFNSIGVIRGERPPTLSPTLLFAEEQGMQLVFISRAEYREKDEPFFKAWLRDQFGSIFIIPEGGSNYAGVQGCTEILTPPDEAFDTIVCACGTGATMAGIILSASAHQAVIGVPVLKGGEFLKESIIEHLTHSLGDLAEAQNMLKQHELLTEYHCGGYAKTSPELLAFMDQFQLASGIPLDKVYTAKVLFALSKEKKKGAFKGKKILAIHTGGLQGGWNAI